MYDSFYRVYGVNWRYSRHERRSLQRASNTMCPNPTANPVSDAEATSYFLTVFRTVFKYVGSQGKVALALFQRLLLFCAKGKGIEIRYLKLDLSDIRYVP